MLNVNAVEEDPSRLSSSNSFVDENSECVILVLGWLTNKMTLRRRRYIGVLRAYSAMRERICSNSIDGGCTFRPGCFSWRGSSSQELKKNLVQDISVRKFIPDTPSTAPLMF